MHTLHISAVCCSVLQYVLYLALDIHRFNLSSVPPQPQRNRPRILIHPPVIQLGVCVCVCVCVCMCHVCLEVVE